jgi:hypothetical protein
MGASKLMIDIPGFARHVSAEVLFDHLRKACKGVDLTGRVFLEVLPDGSVEIDGERVYTPKRLPQADERSA